jgi:hypothetical protein
VQLDEGCKDGIYVRLVHGVAQAPPVHGRPEALELAEYLRARLLGEDAAALDELLTPEVPAGLPLLAHDLALDDVLERDRGVVDAGQPQGLVALHARPPDEGVLDRAV